MSNAENRACLQDLQATDPRDDKDRIEQDKGGLFGDSYHWILEKNSDFQQWRNDQQSRLPWIKGDPGKGKTMLLCGIINELIKPTSHTTNVSFFFFCRRSRAIAVGSARSPSHMTRHGSRRRVKV
jgi:NACHT domain